MYIFGLFRRKQYCTFALGNLTGYVINSSDFRGYVNTCYLHAIQFSPYYSVFILWWLKEDIPHLAFLSIFNITVENQMFHYIHQYFPVILKQYFPLSCLSFSTGCIFYAKRQWNCLSVLRQHLCGTVQGLGKVAAATVQVMSCSVQRRMSKLVCRGLQSQALHCCLFLSLLAKWNTFYNRL